jgi:hypothetical protein
VQTSAGGLLVAGLVALLPSTARGYVRTTTKHGTAIEWVERCIFITTDLRGTTDLPVATLNATLAQAVKNWNDRTTGCGYLSLAALPATHPYEVASDGRPVVVYRNQTWKRPGGEAHDPSAIGLTTVFYVDTPGRIGDGTILDADIELNAVNFTFTVTPENAQARPGTSPADLENTLTHELGHVQGLAHTCWDHQTDTPPLDETGAPIPDCAMMPLPAKITGATMYPYSVPTAMNPVEISKRHLSDDDVHGVCDVYPSNAHRPACFQTVQNGSCAMTMTGGRPLVPKGRWSGPLVTLLVMTLAAARWWRRT